MRSYRISEILYTIIAIVSTYEGIRLWHANPSKAYIFIGFAVVSIGMALFRRHYRKKFNKRAKKSE